MDVEQIEVEILKNLALSPNGKSFVYNAPDIVPPTKNDD
jgi:hypothetical protein